MYQIPDYSNVSEALSEVLVEHGVNDVIVNKRKRTHLLMETASNVRDRMTGRRRHGFIVGSQVEGTTIRQLNPDRDTIVCCDKTNVIHDSRDWMFGVGNLLMVEAEDTTPGYCMLQELEREDPKPETKIIDEHFLRDGHGRIFRKNTHMSYAKPEGREQHGPAFASKVQLGRPQMDLVPAFTCRFQPPVVQHWFSQLHKPWPSDDMKRYIASFPCFLVPIGGKGSANETLEWRISTSLAERYLMFSLNITQLQVYVLMKMLLKTCINYNVPEESHVSSYMCKTVVLHCVQNTEHKMWQSHTLIQCLLYALFILYVCVLNENCPHFIIRSNNLMAGRMKQKAKDQLQENLQRLLVDIISRGILSLHTNEVASTLKQKLNLVMFGKGRFTNDEEYQDMCCFLLTNSALAFQTNVTGMLQDLTENRCSGPVILLRQYVQLLQHIYNDGNPIERTACRYLAPFIYTILGSMIASETIQSSNIISEEALSFFSLGLNSDVSSSRLKLASLFFCTGDMEKAAVVLKDLEGRYDINICEPICSCRKDYALTFVPTRGEAYALASDDGDVSKIFSFCVGFIHAEKNCTPKELHYEMYKKKDLHRNSNFCWMDWAVVDSLPYLHFLCYKVYGRLQRRVKQQRALKKLMSSIQKEPNLSHKETALNLLGQCMEQEKRWNDALHCYIWSLKIRPKNNVANIHICKLLCMRLWHSQD